MATRCRDRAKRMYGDLQRSNAKAAAMVADPSPHVSGICPRRAGKTYAAVMAALITGEAKPGSISLIISLNLKQLRRLYWSGGPSGLFTVARKYGVKLEFNNTYLRWEHENGSFGYLLGAEDADQLEVIRGLEADLYIIDECKSFAPIVLQLLITDIIDPQRISRRGRLIMIGTPGYITSGPFYEATCPTKLDEDSRPYLIGINAQYETVDRTRDAWGRTADDDLLWSCHHWTLQDNTAKPHQWNEALKIKKKNKWADDDPSWRREYLGEWAVGGKGLVFTYGAVKQNGNVTWTPERTAENPTGLPPGDWRFIAGLDLGYEAPTALVICAYSRQHGELRHVFDVAHRHLLPDDIAEMILNSEEQLGIKLEMIFVDCGNLGVTIMETLIRDHGFPMERSQKREKRDYIELVNGGFNRGEIKIIENTQLEAQLLTDAWKLPDDRPETFDDLVRRGKLTEDDAIPNDLTDALLYLYRGSLHHFGIKHIEEDVLVPGSPEWVKKWEKEQLRKMRAQFAAEKKGSKYPHKLPRAPSVVRRALSTPWTSIPPSFSRYSSS